VGGIVMENKHYVVTIEAILEYEMFNQNWIGYIGWDWLQNIIAQHYYKKVKRKYGKYIVAKSIKKRLDAKPMYEE
jgi:hypothetical protein